MPLSSPWVYEAFHHLIGARRWLKWFSSKVIRPRAGDRLFDIGCGPGALLRCLPAGVDYVGFDRNEAYIRRARQVHGNRGNFICMSAISQFTRSRRRISLLQLDFYITLTTNSL